MTTRYVSMWAGLLVFLVGCGSTAPPSFDPAALPSGSVVRPLAGGQLAKLPTGPVYIRLIHFVEPAGHTFQSKQHVPGFVFVEQGTSRLIVLDQPPQDIGANEAVFLGEFTHVHLNLGPVTNSWYFVALWPSSARAQALVDPAVATVAFETVDLGPATLPQGTYSQVLREVTLTTGGRTASHMYGGVSVLFVLRGALTVKAAGATPSIVKAGNGLSYPPDTGLQELNASGDSAVFIELLTTANGKEFETVLNRPPSG